MQIYNVLIATILSLFIIIGWNFLFEQPVIEKKSIQKKEVKKQYKDYKEILNKQEIHIETEKLSGSISPKGLMIDNLFLKEYLSDNYKDDVHLLSPYGSKNAYFIDFNWISNESIKLPKFDTVWSADNNKLTTENPVTFTWNNREGVIFKVILAIDENYMFHIEKIVENNSVNDISLSQYTSINRNFQEMPKKQLITHDGPLGVIKDKLLEISYKDIIKRDKKFNIEEFKNTKRWFGFSDKYWLVSIILPKFEEERLYIKHQLDVNKDHNFKIINAIPFQIIKSGQNLKEQSYFFAGPKDLNLLDHYKKDLNIALFDHAVDFGILYFITKPIFILLQIFYSVVGNFGVAIILLTLFIRVLLLPLSIKSCVSMIKMKEIQPQVLKLKSLYKNDKAKMNKESMLLFKKNNVHPMSGCFPTLLQVPVFFALYKVLFITIQMRHANFFAWIKDLSIPDPTNIFTLFGILNWDTPSLLSIGVLPIILGVTMIVQQKLTQATYEDKTQATMIKLMPYIFIVLFASFPAGLVLYWIFNNIISILQQVVIKKYLVYKSSCLNQKAKI